MSPSYQVVETLNNVGRAGVYGNAVLLKMSLTDCMISYIIMRQFLMPAFATYPLSRVFYLVYFFCVRVENTFT